MGTSIDVTEKLLADFDAPSRPPVLALLDAQATAEESLRLADRGARGVLLHTDLDERLGVALHAVRHGLSVQSERLRGRRPAAAPPPGRSGARHALDRLSPRELAVLERAADGLTNQQIASSLHVSSDTVKGYMSQVLRKLSAERRMQAVAVYWTAQGIAS
ncbi:response regulator transcription factor [Streptomyces sp. PR69]|uniref:response regulator transcription factor n=1 Tax=Streptomyces sp. PR69 TaxID=2984950 RepID=UPI0022644071|nr:LuxR C-terminal-related transcriptional regulator [Streptomyces sp. PR69]